MALSNDSNGQTMTTAEWMAGFRDDLLARGFNIQFAENVVNRAFCDFSGGLGGAVVLPAKGGAK